MAASLSGTSPSTLVEDVSWQTRNKILWFAHKDQQQKSRQHWTLSLGYSL